MFACPLHVCLDNLYVRKAHVCITLTNYVVNGNIKQLITCLAPPLVFVWIRFKTRLCLFNSLTFCIRNSVPSINPVKVCIHWNDWIHHRDTKAPLLSNDEDKREQTWNMTRSHKITVRILLTLLSRMQKKHTFACKNIYCIRSVLAC